MLKWERNKKKKDEKKEEKETPPAREDLENIGLSPSKSSSNISIHNENGTYISHASVAEIKKGYGTIQEYLKQRFGPGKYTISIRGKGGEETQHISIAGEETPSWPENPAPGGVDNNQLMGIYLAQQSEIARLKAELDAIKSNSQQSILGQIVPTAMDFIKTVMQSRPETDLASVMTAATESLRTLSEIRMPGEKSDDIGGLMGGVAQLLQGLQSRQQLAPNPVVIPTPMPDYHAQIIPATPLPSPAPLNMAASSPTPINAVVQPLSPTVGFRQPFVPTPPIQQTTPDTSAANNGGYADVLFENLLGMMEQKQAPKIVATYLMQSIQKIPPQELQHYDPQVQMLVGQLQANPAAAFDAICQLEPGLAADGKYIAEIRAELQKVAPG